MQRLAWSSLLLAATGCQIIIGIDDPPTAYPTQVEARGIVEPIEVRLVSGDIDETIQVAADGIANFSSRVLEGESYALSFVGTPACVLQDPAGIATGEVAASVICRGVTRLASLELATQTGTQPVLQPATLAYTVAVSELQQATSVTARAADPEATFTIAVDDAAIAVVGGTTSELIDLAPASTTITIRVAHPASPVLTSSYTLEITRSLAPVDHAYAKANPQPNDFFGQSVDIEGDTLVVGAAGEGSLANPDDPADTGAALSGAGYVFERDAQGTWQRTAFLKAPNADASDLFGQSVAISGDRIVVGAPFESSASALNTSDNSASHAGAVYVFRREGSGWMFEAYLKAPAPQANALFGWDVAIEGDRVVVGAPGTNDRDTGSGEAFVFQRTNTTWALDGELQEDGAGQGGLGDALGESVAIANGVIAVGARNGEVSGSGVPNTGTARIYTRSLTGWELAQEIGPDDGFLNGKFGISIGMTATHLVVGASAVGVANKAGSAYVFALAGGTWMLAQRLVADTPTSGDEFGAAVDISGDTIAVGAYREDGPGAGLDPLNRTDGTTDAGAVYVFHATATTATSTWSQQHYVKSTAPGGSDAFGQSLALSADALVVGAPGENSGSLVDPNDESADSSGAVSIYR